MMNWSNHQAAVFDAIANGRGNLMIRAVAGSGKTTTILHGMTFVPKGKKCLFVAFNKAIADELAKRAPAGVTVSTLHSLGLRACSKALGRVTVEKDKARGIAAEVTGYDYNPSLRDWNHSVVKAVSLCKNYLASSADEIEDVLNLHQIVPPENEEDRPRLIRHVQSVLAKCLETSSRIDFDDMVWLPVVLKLAVTKYDFVFVDETQDLNATQIALVQKALKKGGRLIAVGDPRQAIYQFRGAAQGAFEKVQESFAANVLPLSVTYRCGRLIVEEARRFVKELEAAPLAEEGRVQACSELRMFNEVQDGDFILSRTNAPLTRICLALLKIGRRAHVQGRDVGTKLSSAVRRTKCEDVESMLASVDRWTAKEIARLEKKDEDTSSVQDTCDCLHALADGEVSTAAVLAKIDALFADGNNDTRITLSSTHKAKGMERDRVWLLRNTYLKVRKGKTKTSKEEENLYYVAVTRAKRELYLVDND
jgi:ATP-dependent DNA helicase UvrD/PcrA